MTDIATLGLRVDGANAIAQVQQFGAASSQAATQGTALESAAISLKAAFVGVAGVLGVGIGIRDLITDSTTAQKSFAQLEAGVRSTGAAAGFTAPQLRDMAMSMQDLTGASHTAIEQTQGIFLLFQNLKGVQFEQATQAAADLAARMGTDVPDAARQLGKALEDPTTGLLMLRRAGIVFTSDQTAVIKALVATGDLMGAQAMILDLVTQKVGGSAAAYRDTLGGALSNLKNQFTDLVEVSKDGSNGVIAVINGIAGGLQALEQHKAVLGDIALGLGVAGILGAASKLLPVLAALYDVQKMSLFAAAITGALAPFVVIAAAIAAGAIAIDKYTGAQNDLTDAEDRDSAAKLKQFEATNQHIQAMEAAAKVAAAATAQAAADAAAAKQRHADIMAAWKAETDAGQQSIDQTVSTMVWEQKHVDLLAQEARATAMLTAQRAQATAALLAEETALAQVKALPYTPADGGSIAIQDGMSGTAATQNAQADAIIAAGATHRAQVATDAANVVDTAFRAQQNAAWTKYYTDLEKQAEQTQKQALTSMQHDMATFFDTLLTGGSDSFGKLWTEVKTGFLKMVSDMVSADAMNQLKDKFGSSLGGLLPGGDVAGTGGGAADGLLETAGIGELLASLAPLAIGMGVLNGVIGLFSNSAEKAAAANNATAMAALKAATSLGTLGSSLDAQVAAVKAATQTAINANNKAFAAGVYSNNKGTGPGGYDNGVSTRDANAAQILADEQVKLAALAKGVSDSIATAYNTAFGNDFQNQIVAARAAYDAANQQLIVELQDGLVTNAQFGTLTNEVYQTLNETLANIAKAQANAAAAAQDAIASVQARLETAQGNPNAAADTRSAQEQAEIDQLIASNASDAVIALTKLAQAAEDAATKQAAAQKVANDQQNAQVRLETARGDASAAADARAAQEQQEIQQLIASGADATTIALTRLAQQAEDTAAAQAAATKAAEDWASLQARYDTAINSPNAAAEVRAAQEQAEIDQLVAAHATDATVALTKLAQAAEDAATAQAAATAAMQATEALQVRDLRALGDTNAADLQALQDKQAAELQQAVDAHDSDAFLALLKKTQADELAQLLAQQAATGTTGTVGTAVATSSTTNVTASLTSAQGDRLLDETTTMRVLLTQIAANTRPLADFGRTVNTALGFEAVKSAQNLIAAVST